MSTQTDTSRGVRYNVSVVRGRSGRHNGSMCEAEGLRYGLSAAFAAGELCSMDRPPEAIDRELVEFEKVRVELRERAVETAEDRLFP